MERQVGEREGAEEAWKERGIGKGGIRLSSTAPPCRVAWPQPYIGAWLARQARRISVLSPVADLISQVCDRCVLSRTAHTHTYVHTSALATIVCSGQRKTAEGEIRPQSGQHVEATTGQGSL